MKCATQTSYRPSEILFNEGDPARHLILIKTGAVALSREGPGETAVIKTVRSGDVLGWSSLIPEATWPSSGQALGETTVTILDAGRVLAAAKENPEFGRELLRRAAEVNDEGLENDEELLKINVAPPAVGSVQPPGETATENSSDFLDEALSLSPSDAKQLSVHDGQWVQLTDRHGSIILPVRVKPRRNHTTSQAELTESQSETVLSRR